ncbi:MAG: diguanylate cyclase [Clostridiaceae bacterium]|nr:diguanylate cyclase [Clostridiaceae bacterium]
MTSKQSLFNLIKEFIYSPKLKDLNVFSKQYLNSIILPHFSNIKNEDNFSCICIDFNKLNDINNLYDYKTGDKIIHYSLSLIKSVLPSNTICARLGGDEFVFIIDNCSPNNIETIIEKMHSVLDKHDKELLFSTISAYGVHCSEKNSISEMIDKADFKITEQKNNFVKRSSHSEWGILKNKLTQNLTSFFKSLRLYKEPITIDFLKSLYVHAISSTHDFLENDFKPVTSELNDSNIINNFSEDDLNKIYSIFSKDDISYKDINSVSENTYSLLLSDLTHDKITNTFSRNYFVNYLIDNFKDKYKIKYFSTSFFKLYNNIFSHNATDVKNATMINDLVSYLENDLNIQFTKDIFSKKEDINYFISLGAGDYILALPSDFNVDNKKINNYIASSRQDSSELEDMLKLTCSQDFHSVNNENYEDLLVDLSNECKYIKDNYKLSIIDKPIIKNSLFNIIYDSIDYYNNNIANSNTIKQKSKFINLLSEVMIEVSSDLNKNLIQNKKKENDFNK